MSVNRPQRESGGGGGGPRGPKRQHRKVCGFCVEKVQYIDYKEISRLRRFVSDRATILPEITAGAKRVFKTSNDLLLLTSSGTGGLESAVANLVSPGDEVIVALCGNFGERFAALAAAYGADVVRLEFEWGQPVDPDDLAKVVERHPNAKVVVLTHNETSTGLTNPLRELARVAHEAGRLVVVDGVSSISSIAIETDA